MKHITQRRIEGDSRSILSELLFDSKRRYALERPWIPDAPGGRPSESCIPAGTYRLRKHCRPNGDDVLALENHGLGVYYLASDRPNDVGRFLVLIHTANYVDEIEGCIAPGRSHRTTGRGRMVRTSRPTMQEIMDYIGDDEAELEIIGDNTYTEEERHS